MKEKAFKVRQTRLCKEIETSQKMAFFLSSNKNSINKYYLLHAYE